MPTVSVNGSDKPKKEPNGNFSKKQFNAFCFKHVKGKMQTKDVFGRNSDKHS